jgi:hypothetical protein
MEPKDKRRRRVPRTPDEAFEGSPGDLEEQHRGWYDDDERDSERSRVPPDAPEADYIDQLTPAELDDDDRY